MAIATLAPLRHRDFAFAWSSSFVSSIGTWMQATAVGVYMIETTRNTAWAGLLIAAAWLPAIIGSPLGGVVSDRWNRQRWIQLNNVIMAAAATTLALCQFTGHLSPWVIVALAVVEGLAGSASWAGWQSLLPDLVDRDEVLGAVSLSSAGFNLGRVIGPAAAAVVFAFGSYGVCFAINAASFVVVVVAFQFVRTAPRPRKNTPFDLFGELIEGARAAWDNAACRHAIASVGAIGIVLSPFIAFIPAMSLLVLNTGKSGTGWLMTAQGVGAVVGAFVVPSIARRTSRLAVMRGSMVVLIASITLYGMAINYAVTLCALTVVGAAYIGTLNGLNTAVQLHAPAAERSRVLSLYTLSLSVSYPVGSLIQGVLEHHLGVSAVTVASGVVAAIVLLAVATLRPRFLRVMGAPAIT